MAAGRKAGAVGFQEVSDVILLNEFTRDEWWDVCHSLRPEMTRAQFDADWDEFQAQKAAREQMRALN